jgi:hypothetical protein
MMRTLSSGFQCTLRQHNKPEDADVFFQPIINYSHSYNIILTAEGQLIRTRYLHKKKNDFSIVGIIHQLS